MWLTPRIRNNDTGLRQDRRMNPMMDIAPAMAELFNRPERWLEDQMSFVPSLDMHETDSAYVLNAEMPGMNPENVDVSVHNNVLELRGEKKEEKEAGENENAWKERRYGAFHRRIPLDQEIDEDKVKASYKDGVLRMEVPKAKTGAGSKNIPIETE